MSALTTYEKPSEALATITDDTKFRLFRRTHGRPEEIPPSDGNGWTKEAFKQAILDQTIPKVPLLIRPLSSRGTLSNKRVSLDLSFSDESTTLETADDGKAMSSAPVGSAIQETVLAALLQSYTDERELVWELREKIDELQEEVAALKTENQKLKSDIEHSSSNDPLSKTIEKALVSVCGGPGGTLLVQKLLGSEAAGALASGSTS